MAIVYEDGSSLPEANAYVDEAFVQNYFMGERLARFNELSEKDSVIVVATQLVDISYEWKGTRKTLEQGLCWPRDNVELEGHEVIGIPAAVKKAVCEAVWIAMNNENLFSDDNQREIVKESVAGAVSLEYASCGESATKYEILDKLLRGLYCVEAQTGGPSIGSLKIERV